jgi:hypothetical protein
MVKTDGCYFTAFNSEISERGSRRAEEFVAHAPKNGAW